MPASTSSLNILVNRCASYEPNINLIDLVFNDCYPNDIKKSPYAYDCYGQVDSTSIPVLLTD